MSHSVKVTLIADQEIELIGETINIHDLEVILLDAKGDIVGYTLFPGKKMTHGSVAGQITDNLLNHFIKNSDGG